MAVVKKGNGQAEFSSNKEQREVTPVSEKTPKWISHVNLPAAWQPDIAAVEI